MRDIKFRAWIAKDRVMFFDGSIIADFFIWLDDWEKSKGPYISMQYTGLKDKNGVEIYEGDILETPYEYAGNSYIDEAGSSGRYKGLTHYRPSKGFIQIKVIQLDDEDDCWRKRQDLEIRQSYTRVIGNIHENPELLK